MPVKSGRITKLRRGTNISKTEKRHRYESFTDKIAKLHSLDPLRRVRRHDLDEEDLSSATSYFRNGLEKWSNVNLAAAFVAFKREAWPLSETLAQILHFEDRIMALLAEHIATHEKESLEPLLDLLTAFAHDLGTRFEKHYKTALELVVGIAGRPQPVEVIEWAFAALAFLFKYLSKLLVPDMRPTFDLLAPLLGRAKHPPFIARFAAESLSFLIKKAAAPSHRETALKLIVDHAKADFLPLAGERQFQLYQDGLMTMFAEAIKGSGETVHSTGPAIFTALLKTIPPEECGLTERPYWTNLVCGVLTSVVHHTNAETLANVVEAIHAESQLAVESEGDSPRPLIPLMRLYGLLAGVRNGSRIADWRPLFQAAVRLLQTTGSTTPTIGEHQGLLVWKYVMTNAAIIIGQASMDAILPSITVLTKTLTNEPFMKWFIPFCSYISDLDPERFRSLFLAPFQKFVTVHWSDESNEGMLCILLPRMIDRHPRMRGGSKEGFNLPQGWQDQIVAKFERLEVTPFPEPGAMGKDPQTWRDRCLPRYSALLHVMELTNTHPSTKSRIAELLLRKLKLALRPSSTLASDEVHFIVSQGFRAYLQMSQASASLDPGLGPLLRAAVPRFCTSVGFLEAYLAYELEIEKHPDRGTAGNGSSPDSSSNGDDPVIEALVKNLSCPSHELRLKSLKILRQIEPTAKAAPAVTLMLEIEETPLSLESGRTLGMNIRSLGKRFATSKTPPWLSQAIPAFLFGMMTLKLSSIWDDAIEAMQKVAESKAGEEAICALAFEWLETASPRHSNLLKPVDGPYTARTNFDCTNFQRLEKMAAEVEEAIADAPELMLQSFDKGQAAIDLRPHNARAQALRVLSVFPAAAERRSRRLVPILLSGTGDAEDQLDETDEALEESFWSYSDKKGLFGLVAQFTNPRSLYQSDQVYQRFLSFLKVGDVELQKIVLKVILTWKQEGVRPYQENLEFLLDDARFKNELTVFMQGDETIKPEHRQQLMPVLLRLLYGRVISKKGAKGQKMQVNRLAVIRNLRVEDMGTFLDIVLDELNGIHVVDANGVRDALLGKELLPLKRQVGFLNMVLAIIGELGAHIEARADSLVNAVLYCLFNACRKLQGKLAEVGDEDEDAGRVDHESILRTVRTTGLKCLISLFRYFTAFDWTPYSPAIVAEIISPRIENLPAETTQGVSGILQLFSTWAQLPKSAMILGLDGRVLPKLIECVSGPKTKEDVKTFVLEIVRSLIKVATSDATESEFNELVKEELIDANLDLVLHHVSIMLESQTVGPELLETSIETIIEVSDIADKSEHIPEILRLSVFLLRQPPKRVSPKAKGRILVVLEQFLALRASTPTTESSLASDDSIYETISNLFGYFKDRENRTSLSRVLHVMAAGDSTISEVAHLCADLNAYVEDRIDTPDYDRRLTAFTTVSKKEDCALTPRQWLPILHNAVFFIKKDEEYGILSSNSADCIRRFIRDAAVNKDDVAAVKYELYLKSVVLPAIYSGSREESELVRREYLMVLGFLLSKMPQWPPVSDLKGLLMEADAESSDPIFFFNILSPAVARQMEALQLLESANQRFEMSSQNLSHFFIPILEHFIFGRADGTDDHGLGAQATNTISSLAMSLDWKHYRVILQRYISFIESKPDSQKQVVRLLGKVADALILATQATTDGMDVDDANANAASGRRLSLTLPKAEKLSTDIVDAFLPSLIKHLHEKDESEVSYRVPVGVIIVKLLKTLPEEQMNLKLAGVLTDICHILRSKAWESRDMARDTLVKISLILGSSSLGFILKELRGALTRGYQLHVLSYTMHSILLAVIPEFKQGELDYCLKTIVAVIMDDIFGVTGQEKEAEGYNTQMKEIKSSKSQDSLELVAKSASINHLIDLVQPLQSLLMQKVDLKMVRKVDTLLSRISAGLLQNPAAASRDTLVFCYEVIQEVYNSQKPEAAPKIDFKVRKYLVQRGANKSGDRGKTSKYTHKLVRFALDILRSSFKKYDDLRTVTNITGFIPIFGDALVNPNDEVKEAAFKLLTVLVKVPLPTSGVGLYKVAIKEATKTISMAPSTTSILSQSSLKLISVVLREKPDIVVKDAAIDVLLGKVKDDLTEPLHRHVTFNFLRCVLDRMIQTAVVYDTLDYVGTVMITNDDNDTRDLARGAYFQFIRTYPMQKRRWAKQLDFIVANLKYDREGGRLSVMEIIHLLLMKSAQDFVQEVASTCFLPLVFVVANDESEKCQLAAGELVKEIFRKADKDAIKSFVVLLRSWLEQEDKAAVEALALQVFGFFFEVREPSDKDKQDMRLVLERVADIVGTGDIRLRDTFLVKAALRAVETLLDKYPEVILSPEHQGTWAEIRGCLSHPEGAVKLKTIKLLSSYLADFAGATKTSVPGGSLQGSHSTELANSDVEDFVRLALGILLQREVEEALAAEAAQILLFMVPYLPVRGEVLAEGSEDEVESDEEVDEDADEDSAPTVGKRQKDLQYVFWRLSGILRKEIAPKAAAMAPKVAAMDVLETLCRTLPPEHVALSAKTILRTLHHLTDPSIAAPFSTDEGFKTRHELVRGRAAAAMDALQKTLGTGEYSRQLLAVRDEVKARREQRSAKRKIAAVADPERFGRDKVRKWGKTKERRKAKGMQHKAMRHAYKGIGA